MLCNVQFQNITFGMLCNVLFQNITFGMLCNVLFQNITFGMLCNVQFQNITFGMLCNVLFQNITFGMLCNVLWLSLSLVQVLRSSDFSTYPQHNVRINTLLHIDSWLVSLLSALFLAFPEVVLSILVSHTLFYIIIIKLYLNTIKSGTAAPFTGVYTHFS